MRHGFEATTYTCSASGRVASSACAPRPTTTARPSLAASRMTRSVILWIAVSSRSAADTAASVMNSSGEAAASVRARRSSTPDVRSSRCATSARGSPARRATSSTNSLSITVQPSCVATSWAMSEPPEAYWRVIVMRGGAMTSNRTAPSAVGYRQSANEPSRKPNAESRRRCSSEQVRPRPRPGLSIARTLRLRPDPRISQIFGAGNAARRYQPLEHQLAGGHDVRRILLAGEPHPVHQVEQARHDAEALEQCFGALVGGDFQGAAFVEPVHDVVDVGAADARLERLAGRALDEVLGDGVGALQLALVFQLELPRDRRQRGVHVRYTRHDRLFLGHDAAPFGARDDVLERTDRQAL